MWRKFLGTSLALLACAGVNLASATPAGSPTSVSDTLRQLLSPTPNLQEGQSATQLADGRWLLLGGAGSAATVARLQDVQGQFPVLSSSLKVARQSHSATLLPDGSVLILGGTGRDGALVTQAERFDPATAKFELLAATPLLARSGHSATVLEDGRLLIAGGKDARGNALSAIELYDPVLNQVERFNTRLGTARWQQLASLLPSRQLLLWGGWESASRALGTGELLDLKTQRITALSLAESLAQAQSLVTPALPAVLDSLPVANASNVAVSQRLMVRLSKRMAVSSLNTATVTLLGPAGVVVIQPVAVEGGQLLFVTPKQELLPASQYTLFIQGATDEAGQVLPFTAIGFKTGALGARSKSSTKNGGVAVATASATSTPATSAAAAATNTPNASAVPEPDERWIPGASNYHGSWLSGRRPLARNTLPQQEYLRARLYGDISGGNRLRPTDVTRAHAQGRFNQFYTLPPAPTGETALSGQVLKLNGYPLANATLSIGSASVRTNGNGEFLLSGIPTGHQVLVIDGSSADRANRHYGRYEYGIDIKANELNVLPFVVWMIALDPQGDAHLSSPTRRDTVITNPAIPGLELHIPAGTVIRDAQGRIVTEINLTAIPVDQPPFPLPADAPVPVYFTIQPGGAHLSGIDARSARGAQLIYPNFTQQLPGERVAFWNYDPTGKGWYKYGMGTVTADGKQVKPDAGVVIYEFTGAMVSSPDGAQPEGPAPGEDTGEGRTGDGSNDGTPAPAPAPQPSGEGAGGGGGRGGSGSICPGPNASRSSAESELYASWNGQRVSRVVEDEESAYKTQPSGEQSWVSMLRPGSNQPKEPLAVGGDPVDLNTGLFLHERTDMIVRDTIPIAVDRTYRNRDSRSRGFGVGTSLSYDMFLVGDINPYTYMDLILPDGGRLHYARLSPGTEWTQAVYQNTTGPTRFHGSIIQFDTSVSPYIWRLTLKDGTTYRFYEAAGATNPRQGAVGRIEDRNGNTVTLDRDANYNLTKITSPNGRGITLAYDTNNRITSATDDIGRTVQYAYDTQGRLITVTDPLSHTETYTYDSSHNLLTVTDWRSNVMVTNEYDTNNRVKKQTYADSSTNLFSYTLDGSGKVTQTDFTNRRGVVKRVSFGDNRGYITGVVKGQGSALAQTYGYPRSSTTSLKQSYTDDLGRTTGYQYDNLGNTTQITQLQGTGNAVSTTIAYDPYYANPILVTDPLGHSTQYSYDSKGNLTAVTDALGHAITYTRDPRGRVIKVKDALNHETSYSYNGGDLAGVTDALGRTTRFYYDGVGRLTTTTNPLGLNTYYSYDVLDRISSITNAHGKTVSFTYDNNGNRLTQTDEGGNTTTFTYDSMNRLLTAVDALNHTTTRAYETSGRLQRVTDRKSQVTGFSYDDLGRVTQVGYGATTGSPTSYSSTVANTWDDANRLTQVVDSVGGTITRTYDDLSRLTQEVTTQGTVNYTYDAANRRATMTVQGQPVVSYTYDNANRLIQITQAAGTSNGNVAQTVSFSYDNANRLTQKTLPNGSTAAYSYDNANQLTAITYRKSDTTLIGDLTYAYDAAGQRTSIGGSLAQVNFPSSVSSTTYNVNNQLTAWGSSSFTYDLNGNLTGDGTNTYTWNARNQLTGISGGSTASFSYDAFGRRIGKTVNSTTTGYVYDGLNFVQEKNGTGSGASVTANLLTGGIDQTFLRSAGGTLTSYLTDALGSTVALSNTGETVLNSYSYEPYGATTPTGSSTNSHQYTGRENDGTGLYYYRARYYHPTLGRFISEDPIGWASGQSNQYIYVRANPISFMDPHGLSALSDYVTQATADAAAAAAAGNAPGAGVIYAWRPGSGAATSGSGGEVVVAMVDADGTVVGASAFDDATGDFIETVESGMSYHEWLDVSGCSGRR